MALAGSIHRPFTLAPLGLAAALLSLAPACASAAAEGPVGAAAAAFDRIERETVEALSRELDGLVADPALVAAFRSRDRDALLSAARPRLERLAAERNVSHFYFLEPEPARTCFLRVHKPSLHGDVVDRETFSQAIASRKIGFGKELGKTAFALRVVKPMKDAGKVIGYLELGEDIDRFVERVQRETGYDFGILVEKKRVDRAELARVRNDDRWDERPDVVLVVSTMWDEKQIDIGGPLAKLPAKGTPVREWKDGARTWAGGAFPLRDAGKRVIGALFVRHEVSPR
jgi:hypothetical protein